MLKQSCIVCANTVACILAHVPSNIINFNHAYSQMHSQKHQYCNRLINTQIPFAKDNMSYILRKTVCYFSSMQLDIQSY